MRTIHAIAAAVPLTLCGFAQADTITSVLNTSWGDLDTGVVAFDTITINDAVASIDAITLVIAHSYEADLDITVNGFSEFDLMFNEGSGFSLGDGLGTGLANAMTYTYVPIGTGGAFTNFGVFDPNPSGMYEANAWNAGSFVANTDFTLVVGDLFQGDGGSVVSWSIDYTPLPGPGSLALLGLAGVAGGRRRRH
jgi:MYXO-CTERM domain-containing protein